MGGLSLAGELHGGDESITPPRDIDDISSVAVTVTECFPKCGDMDLQVGFDDIAIGPYRQHQFALTHHLAGLLYESNQDVQGPAAQAQRLGTIEKQPLSHKQTERPERYCLFAIGIVWHDACRVLLVHALRYSWRLVASYEVLRR